MRAAASAATCSSFLRSKRSVRISKMPRKRSISAYFGHLDVKDHCIKDCVLIDPCMGSGHILVYMFDVLEQIYTSVGYSEREAAKAILENNIYGLDIDDRAYQLAYFAVMMKARQYNRRILTSGIKAHVYSIQESNGITKNQLQEMGENLSPDEKAKALSQAEKLVELFHDAKEYGSILNIPEMDWDLLRRFATPEEKMGQTSLNWNQETSEKLMRLIDQGGVMAKKYWVVCTNPPYMGELTEKLKSFAKTNYADSKHDLCTMFIERNLQLVPQNGILSMITQHAFMFLSRYEKLRHKLLQYNFINMIHLGSRAFDAISGEVVQTTAFAIRKNHVELFNTLYSRLVSYTSEASKEEAIINNKNIYITNNENFERIPREPMTYWVSKNAIAMFENPRLDDVADPRVGMFTTNNEKYLREWWEVSVKKIGFDFSDKEKAYSSDFKWFPYNKGGGYRRWYGNYDLVVNWYHGGEEIKNVVIKKYPYLKGNYDFVLKTSNPYYNPGITWSGLTDGSNSFRLCPKGFLFDTNKGAMLFKKTISLEYLLGLLNSKVAQLAINILNSTISLQIGDVSAIPVKIIRDKETIEQLAYDCVNICKQDWDEREISWDYVRDPIIINKDTNLPIGFNRYEKACLANREQLWKDEEQINSIFIEEYNLQNELDSNVSDGELTLNRVSKKDAAKNVLSYSIGCMFGRYSLDKEGLIYAGGDWKSVQSVYKSFLPDRDNVIPITDQKYLDDDVVERICEFLTVVYGADTLEENLDFIAKALGNKGLTSCEVIRNYMLNDFFKDHCKTYSVTGSGKRPIYWLFDSGKENAFKALVYMHRWDADTTGRVLLYAQQIQQKYETEIRAIDMMLDHITDARQKSTEEKRQEHLKKQLEELVNYEERLEHMANERIAIDLDDGVKVNYEKVQTDRNGKKYQILAPIK